MSSPTAPLKRRHRFMESADINAAFRSIFQPLRNNIRRGMTIDGQFYGLEMDACIPGELLGCTWLHAETPPATTAACCARLQLLCSEGRPEALFVHVSERRDAAGKHRICIDMASVDGCYSAEMPIRRGSGWHRRELLPAPHRRIDPLTLA